MEMLVCLIVGVVIFLNPDKAEEYGRTMSSFLRQFKKGFSEIKEERDVIMEPLQEIKDELKN